MEQIQIMYPNTYGLVRKYAKTFTCNDDVITFATKSWDVHNFNARVLEWYYEYLQKVRTALLDIKKGDRVHFFAGYDRTLHNGVVQKINKTFAVGKFPIKSVTVITKRYGKEERLVLGVNRSGTYYHWLPACYWHSYDCLKHKLNCMTVCYNEIEKIYNEIRDSEIVLFLG